MKTNIIVRLQFEGVHAWYDCPLDEVDFLRAKHRHIFFVEAKKEVSHDNRQVEIILLKRKMQNYIKQTWNGELDQMSCEMIAKHLLIEFALCYCSVTEDNENGAEVFV